MEACNRGSQTPYERISLLNKQTPLLKGLNNLFGQRRARRTQKLNTELFYITNYLSISYIVYARSSEETIIVGDWGMITQLNLERIEAEQFRLYNGKLVNYTVKMCKKSSETKTCCKVTNVTPDQQRCYNLVGIKNPSNLENYLWWRNKNH